MAPPAIAEPASVPVASLPDEFVAVAWHGIPGVFITAQAFRDMLVGFEIERGELRLQTAHATALRRLSDEKLSNVLQNSKMLEWRATWGVPLGIAIGASVMAVVLGAVLGSLKLTVGNFLQGSTR